MLPASAAAAAEATRVRPRDVVERDQRGLRSRPGRPRRGVSAFHKCKHEWLCLPGSTPKRPRSGGWLRPRGAWSRPRSARTPAAPTPVRCGGSTPGLDGARAPRRDPGRLPRRAARRRPGIIERLDGSSCSPECPGRSACRWAACVESWTRTRVVVASVHCRIRGLRPVAVGRGHCEQPAALPKRPRRPRGVPRSGQSVSRVTPVNA